MIKLILSASFCLLAIQLFSQDKTVTKYYDSLWSSTSKDSAYYFTEFTKEGNLYKASAYWANSKKLNGVGFFADTSLAKPRNLLINYYENGRMQDSTWYDKNSQVMFAYHYYPSGKLLARHIVLETTEGFDEEGRLIKDFIYAKEAEFPDGDAAWLRFISKNVNTQVPVKNRAPAGTYRVMILFVVDKNGETTNFIPETNHGYGMEEEAIRVLRNSPRWNPLIFLGEPKNAYRRQPVTFIVDGK